MRSRPARLVVAALALAGAVVAAACTEDARSPVGVDILPGGILEGGLQSVSSDAFDRVADYTIFPARRADGDRLPTALAWPDAPGIESRAIFRFVVAQSDSLVENSELLDASVRLVYSLESAPSVPVDFTLHRVTRSWSEEAATWERRLLGVPWDTPGGDFEPEPVATFTIEPSPVEPDSAIQADSLEVEIPLELAQAWRTEEIENHGLILIQRTPGERIEFASRAGGDLSLNSNGPTLLMNQRLAGEGEPIQLTTILAREDIFLANDASPLPGDPGLVVSAGDPTRRIFMRSSLVDLPIGATVAGARLVLTVEAAEIPGDTLFLVGIEAQSEFLGEKTIFRPFSRTRPSGAALGVPAVAPDVQPGDTVVFESPNLTRAVRRWLADPEGNRGFGILALGEGSEFGAVRFHGPDAPVAVRPRFELLILPPPTESGSR